MAKNILYIKSNECTQPPIKMITTEATGFKIKTLKSGERWPGGGGDVPHTHVVQEEALNEKWKRRMHDFEL